MVASQDNDRRSGGGVPYSSEDRAQARTGPERSETAEARTSSPQRTISVPSHTSSIPSLRGDELSYMGGAMYLTEERVTDSPPPDAESHAQQRAGTRSHEQQTMATFSHTHHSNRSPASNGSSVANGVRFAGSASRRTDYDVVIHQRRTNNSSQTPNSEHDHRDGANTQNGHRRNND